jgi:ribosome-associated protein
MKDFFIPKEELRFEFFRSPGPGGQKVNKVSSGVRVRFDIEKSKTLTEDQKEKIKNFYLKRITKEKELIVERQESRSQLKNKELAIERLQQLLKEGLREKKKRKKRKISKAQKEKRIQKKKMISKKKKLRKMSKEELYNI